MKNLIHRLLGQLKPGKKPPTFEDRIAELVKEEIQYFATPGLQVELAKITHAKERALVDSLLADIAVPFVLEAGTFPAYDFKCLTAQVQVTTAKRMWLTHLKETTDLSPVMYVHISAIYWVVLDSLRRQLMDVESQGVQQVDMDKWLEAAQKTIYA